MATNDNPPLLHVVYIHGFQGDDTSFQSFPLHLQDHLSTIISQNPSKYPFKVQSSLYPTYKSIKHLSYATKNFLEWLQTQPPGPVILIGHSMGGLLAAEAASDPSNAPLVPGGKPRRVVGIIAFDVPFLGMHPHVVISGLASLLPKGDSDGEDEGEKPTTPSQLPTRPGDIEHGADKDMDAHPDINLVSSQATDEWEEFKQKVHRKRTPRSPDIDGDSYLDIPPREGTRSPSIRSASPSSPGSSTFSKLSASSSRLSASGRRSPFLAKAFDLASPYISQATSYFEAHADDPLARWLIKHSSSSDSEGLAKASKRWVIERMQFGGSMFDPSELRERYDKLLKWGGSGGIWINYYTVTDPKAQALRDKEKERKKRRDEALAQSGLAPHTSSGGSSDDDPSPKPPGKLKKSKDAKRKGEEKEQRDLDKEKGHHFVMLPSSSVFVQAGHYVFAGRVSKDPLDSWPRVTISGAADEVEAHCGLFIPKLNLEYENFVRAVGKQLLDWCGRERDGWGLNGS